MYFKKLSLFLFAALLSLQVSAQNYEAHKKGNFLISPGIGLGSYYGGGFYGFGVPVSVSAEIGVHDFVGVGGWAGFASYGYNWFGAKYRDSYVGFGARATFHWYGLLEKLLKTDIHGDKLDIYYSLMLGYYIRNTNNDSWTANYGGFGWGSTGGIRYYLKPKFGLFFEGGRASFGYATFGLTLKL